LQGEFSATLRQSSPRVPLPDAETAVFSRVHREMLVKAIDEAETHTAGYYCIPPRGWQRLSYDLITRMDREWEPIPESALARIQQLQRINARRREHADFFRIQLNDPSILNAARRENLEPDLYPFFVYILTHEMVHMVRLGTILDGAELRQHGGRESEEDRVDRISRQILLKARSGSFSPVFEKFRRPCLNDLPGGSS
jgi:hypothetical protein